MSTSNAYCAALGIRVPRVEDARSSPDFNYYSLLLVALLERERDAHAEQLARMRRVLIHAFPAARPEALALVDVAGRAITMFIGDEIARAIDRLAGYEIIGAVGVRALLRT